MVYTHARDECGAWCRWSVCLDRDGRWYWMRGLGLRFTNFVGTGECGAWVCDVGGGGFGCLWWVVWARE